MSAQKMMFSSLRLLFNQYFFYNIMSASDIYIDLITDVGRSLQIVNEAF